MRQNFEKELTSRDWPKSAPYPRLKNCKRTFKCQFTVLENRKTKKMDRVARWDPLARASGALKGGHFRNCQHFCRSWRRDPLEKQQIFEKKSHHAEKLKGDPFRFFKHPICCKISKKLERGPFGEKKFSEKNLTVPKKTERGTLWDFPTSFLSQNSKRNWRGDPLEEIFFPKKVAVRKKIERGDPLVSPGIVCYAGKQEKSF